MNGRVIRIFKDKGFGFIKGEDGREFFFYKNALKNINFEEIEKDQDVTFEESESSKGLRAEDIYV